MTLEALLSAGGLALLSGIAAAAIAWIWGRSAGRRQGRMEAEHAQDRRTLEDVARAQGAERDLGADPHRADGVQRFYRD